MSDFAWSQCACGSRIIAISINDEDLQLAVASHQRTRQHEEWRAVQSLIEWRRPKGPCICKGYAEARHA